MLFKLINLPDEKSKIKTFTNICSLWFLVFVVLAVLLRVVVPFSPAVVLAVLLGVVVSFSPAVIVLVAIVLYFQ